MDANRLITQTQADELSRALDRWPGRVSESGAPPSGEYQAGYRDAMEDAIIIINAAAVRWPLKLTHQNGM